jgi:cytochrome oxidase assembly protein ShyY1
MAIPWRSARVLSLGVFTLVMLVVLVGLGLWQLQRKAEKVALIEALTERLAAAPAALPAPSDWARLEPGRDEFRRVRFRARPLDLPQAKVFASGSALRGDVSGLGAFVFAPYRLASGANVVVDRGFLPDGQAAAPAFAEAAGAELELTGYLRFPESPGWFTPAADLGKRLWFARESTGMARQLGWGEVAPFYIDLETPAPRAGWPKPGPLEVHLRDQHLQYAITWFGLALVVGVAFLVWLRAQGRG